MLLLSHGPCHLEVFSVGTPPTWSTVNGDLSTAFLPVLGLSQRGAPSLVLRASSGAHASPGHHLRDSELGAQRTGPKNLHFSKAGVASLR